MPQLKALIFDLDGVLVNTVDLHYRAWRQLFAELGVAFEPSDMDRLRGVHRRQILLSCVGGLSEAQIEAYLARKDALYKRNLHDADEAAILQTPVIDVLRAGKACGLKIGLASSSVNAHYVLERLRLKPLFDAIADGATVCRSKPAPDIFVWVAGALNVSPEECAVIEDGSAGIQAARAAGMFVVGLDVPDGAHLGVALRDVRFEDIANAYQQARRDQR